MVKMCPDGEIFSFQAIIWYWACILMFFCHFSHESKNVQYLDVLHIFGKQTNRPHLNTRPFENLTVKCPHFVCPLFGTTLHKLNLKQATKFQYLLLSFECDLRLSVLRNLRVWVPHLQVRSKRRTYLGFFIIQITFWVQFESSPYERQLLLSYQALRILVLKMGASYLGFVPMRRTQSASSIPAMVVFNKQLDLKSVPLASSMGKLSSVQSVSLPNRLKRSFRAIRDWKKYFEL